MAPDTTDLIKAQKSLYVSLSFYYKQTLDIDLRWQRCREDKSRSEASNGVEHPTKSELSHEFPQSTLK